MDDTLTPSPLRLERGAVVSMRLPVGSTLLLAAGRVWLTEPGDSADHFIAAGQTHCVRHAGAVVIEGDSAEPAVVRFSGRASTPRPTAPALLGRRARPA